MGGRATYLQSRVQTRDIWIGIPTANRKRKEKLTSLSLTLSVLFLRGLTDLAKSTLPESSDVIHLGTNSANHLELQSYSEI